MTPDYMTVKAENASLRRQLVDAQVQIETLKAQVIRLEREVNRNPRWRHG